jgi:hypothetical protein
MPKVDSSRIFVTKNDPGNLVLDSELLLLVVTYRYRQRGIAWYYLGEAMIGAAVAYPWSFRKHRQMLMRQLSVETKFHFS